MAEARVMDPKEAEMIANALKSTAKAFNRMADVFLLSSGLKSPEPEQPVKKGRYSSAADLAADYSVSVSTIKRRIDMIRSNADLFPADSIISYGGHVRVRNDVFEFVVANYELLKRGRKVKFVRQAI